MNGARVAIAVAVAVVVIVAGFIVVMLRRRGPSKTSGNLLRGIFSHEQGAEPSGIVIKNAESSHGGTIATDNAGLGVTMDGVKVKKDIIATNNPPPNPKV
jgi:hypothetical protein